MIMPKTLGLASAVLTRREALSRMTRALLTGALMPVIDAADAIGNGANTSAPTVTPSAWTKFVLSPVAARMLGRYLTINTIVRKYQVESTPGNYAKEYADETSLHDAAVVGEFAETIRSNFPDARITWAFSWLALTDSSSRYSEIRNVIKAYHCRYGDEVTYDPGGYAAPRWSSREEINRELSNAFDHIERLIGGYRPTSLVTGMLPVDCIHFARRALGVTAVQGNIWSQYNVDVGDSEGSIAYPYYPSSEHFLKPAQGDDDFIDCINFDGWTVDFVAGRFRGGLQKNGGRINSRLGLGPIETLHTYGREIGLEELQATSMAHLSEENLARNPFAWITTNYEISEVVRGRTRKAGLAAFGEWLGWLHKTWPDLQCPTLAEFGGRVRANYPNNEGLKYILRQRGSSIGGSFAGQEVTWFMNKSFRLAVLREKGEALVIDYTDYRRHYAEPKGVGERNWSLWGEINQKQLRPQDQPLPIAEFTRRWPKVIEELHHVYPDAAEVREFFS